MQVRDIQQVANSREECTSSRQIETTGRQNCTNHEGLSVLPLNERGNQAINKDTYRIMNYIKAIIYSFILLMTISVGRPAQAEKDSTGKQDYEKATILFKAKEYKAALLYFEKSHASSGGRASTLLGMAQCERALGLYKKAIQHFEEFLNANPTHPQVERIQSTLEVTRLLEKSQSKHSIENLKDDVSAPPAEPKQPELEKQEVQLVAAPLPSPGTHTSVSDEEDSIFASPWFWVTTGLALVGGAVSVSYALSSEDVDGTATTFDGGTTDRFFQPL